MYIYLYYITENRFFSDQRLILQFELKLETIYMRIKYSLLGENLQPKRIKDKVSAKLSLNNLSD